MEYRDALLNDACRKKGILSIYLNVGGGVNVGDLLISSNMMRFGTE